MRLIIIGCEYAGKTTLAEGITRWVAQTMGVTQDWHDHFVMPFDEGKGRAIEQGDMRPTLLEAHMRYMIDYHSGGFSANTDHWLIDWYYGDAVYAPLYYGYGGRGEYADRRAMARSYDAKVKQMAPDTVLVLMKASAEVIRRRMRENPRSRNPFKAQDVELVLERFEEEYGNSLIQRRFTLNTTDASAAEVLDEFLAKMEPHLTSTDRLRIMSHQKLQR